MILKPDTCKDCLLCDHPAWGNARGGFSILEGDGTSRLMVVAEALGAQEERAGLPLRPTAPAGGVFQKAVDVSGLNRAAMTLTNIVRCRPPGNDLLGMPYERDAIDHCKQYLDQAVSERKPRLILALGGIPLRELSVVGGTISDMRGFVLQSRYGIPMIATYHPSHLARDAFHLFGAFQHDLRRASSYALSGIPEPLETNYDLKPSGVAVRAYLDRLHGDRSLPAAYDLETRGILGDKINWDEIIQIQFSSAAGTALVLPWKGEWKDAAEEILATPNPKWGWNDRLFDRPLLKKLGVYIGGETHDLMNMWGHSQPNFVSSKDDAHGDKGIPARLMGLQSCTSFYYPYEGPWKGMVEAAVKEAATRYKWICANEDRKENKEELLAFIEATPAVWNALRWYGARDADMTFRCGVRLVSSLKKVGLW